MGEGEAKMLLKGPPWQGRLWRDNDCTHCIQICLPSYISLSLGQQLRGSAQKPQYTGQI